MPEYNEEFGPYNERNAYCAMLPVASRVDRHGGLNM